MMIFKILDNDKLHLGDLQKEVASNPLQSQIKWKCGLKKDIRRIISDIPVNIVMTNEQKKILDDWYTLNYIMHNMHHIFDQQAGWPWSLLKIKKSE